MNIRKMALLAVVPAVLALGACGDDGEGTGIASANRGGGKPGGSASPSRSMSHEDAALKFAQCMRQNGVDMEDPVNGRIMIKNNQGDGRKTQDAMKKCQPIMEAAGRPSDVDDQEMRDRMLKFAQCMREHGVNVADPKPGGGIDIRADGVNKAKLEAAQKACGMAEGGPASSAVRD